jgi:hypothetical protein
MDYSKIQEDSKLETKYIYNLTKLNSQKVQTAFKTSTVQHFTWFLIGFDRPVVLLCVCCANCTSCSFVHGKLPFNNSYPHCLQRVIVLSEL